MAVRWGQQWANQEQRDTEIYRVFEMLGYPAEPTGPSGRRTSAITRGTLRRQHRSGGAGATGLLEPPDNLKPFMQDIPAAIADRDGNSFWAQFGKGILSPVTDTLSGFGVTDPRRLPTGVMGMLGNMAGSIIGWGALTGLVTVATGGAGTVPMLAAAKMGLAAKIGTGVLKGAAAGGLTQAHTFAFGQQNYGAIPREMLTGALWGGAFGGVFAGAGQYLRKTGKIVPEPHEFLGRADIKRDIDNLISTDDPVSMMRGLRKVRSEDTYITRELFFKAPLTTEATDGIKSLSKDLRARGLPKEFLKKIDKIEEVKTLGGISSILSGLTRSQQHYTKISGGSFNNLNAAQQVRSSAINDAIQELHNVAKGQITKIANADKSVLLPSLYSIPDPVALKQHQRVFRSELLDEGKLVKGLDYGPNVHRFLKRVADDTGVNYYPDPTDFKSSAFLSGKAEKFVPEWDKLMKEIKPGDITLRTTGLGSLNVLDDIEGNDLIQHFKKISKITPEMIATHGNSIADSMILRSPIGRWTAWFGHLRGIVGERFFRSTRNAGIAFSTEVDEYVSKITKIGVKHGYTSEKARLKMGDEIGKLLEGNYGPKAGLNTASSKQYFRTAIGLINNKEVDEAVKFIKNKFRLTKAEATDLVDRFNKFRASKDVDALLKKAAENDKVELDVLLGDIIGKFVHDAKLQKVITAKGNETIIKGIMNDMGVTDKKHLLAAADGRAYFDEVFNASGMDSAKYRVAYLPHMRRVGEQTYNNIIKEFADVGTDMKIIDKILWANELSRFGHMTSYDTNFFRVAERYTRGWLKQKHFAPVFKEFKRASKEIKMDDSRQKVYAQLQQHIRGIPSEMEKSFDRAFANFAGFLGQDATPVTTKLIGSVVSELQYLAGLGYNPFMPIRNLTQKALAFSSISDSGNPIEGMHWMAKFKLAKAAKDPEAMWINSLNDITTSRVFAEALEIKNRGMVQVAKIFGASDAAAGRIDDITESSMKMFRWSDISNVEDTFGARAMYLRSKGFSTADVVEMSRSTTMATQFMYGIDSPMLYKTPLGKQIGIFQSWPLNWAHMLWEQGTQGNMKRAVSTVAVMAVAAELLTMTGWCFRSIHPTDTARGILPLSMLGGERDFPLVIRLASPIFDYMRGLGDGEEAAVDAAMTNFIRAAEGLVPFGAVTNRTLKFLDRARHDWRDYADTGFMHSSALKLSTREGTSRLVRILDENPALAAKEAGMALLGATTKSIERNSDIQFIRTMTDARKRMRRMAVQAFIDGDYSRFQQLQEQLVFNFNDWIEPEDIKQEVNLMSLTAAERQTQSWPAHLKDDFFDAILDPRAPKPDLLY